MSDLVPYCTITVDPTNVPGFWTGRRQIVWNHDLKDVLPRHLLAGRTYTASGYGLRIPTRFKVLVNRRWRRVYSCCVSNTETLFIGPSLERGHIVELFNV